MTIIVCVSWSARHTLAVRPLALRPSSFQMIFGGGGRGGCPPAAERHQSFGTQCIASSGGGSSVVVARQPRAM